MDAVVACQPGAGQDDAGDGDGDGDDDDDAGDDVRLRVGVNLIKYTHKQSGGERA